MRGSSPYNYREVIFNELNDLDSRNYSQRSNSKQLSPGPVLQIYQKPSFSSPVSLSNRIQDTSFQNSGTKYSPQIQTYPFVNQLSTIQEDMNSRLGSVMFDKQKEQEKRESMNLENSQIRQRELSFGKDSVSSVDNNNNKKILMLNYPQGGQVGGQRVLDGVQYSQRIDQKFPSQRQYGGDQQGILLLKSDDWSKKLEGAPAADPYGNKQSLTNSSSQQTGIFGGVEKGSAQFLNYSKGRENFSQEFSQQEGRQLSRDGYGVTVGVDNVLNEKRENKIYKDVKKIPDYKGRETYLIENQPENWSDRNNRKGSAQKLLEKSQSGQIRFEDSLRLYEEMPNNNNNHNTTISKKVKSASKKQEGNGLTKDKLKRIVLEQEIPESKGQYDWQSFNKLMDKMGIFTETDRIWNIMLHASCSNKQVPTMFLYQILLLLLDENDYSPQSAINLIKQISFKERQKVLGLLPITSDQSDSVLTTLIPPQMIINIRNSIKIQKQTGIDDSFSVSHPPYVNMQTEGTRFMKAELTESMEERVGQSIAELTQRLKKSDIESGDFIKRQAMRGDYFKEESVHRRLFEDAGSKFQRVIENQEIKERETTEELAECTFKPRINKNTDKLLARSKSQHKIGSQETPVEDAVKGVRSNLRRMETARKQKEYKDNYWENERLKYMNKKTKGRSRSNPRGTFNEGSLMDTENKFKGIINDAFGNRFNETSRETFNESRMRDTFNEGRLQNGSFNGYDQGSTLSPLKYNESPYKNQNESLQNEYNNSSSEQYNKNPTFTMGKLLNKLEVTPKKKQDLYSSSSMKDLRNSPAPKSFGNANNQKSSTQGESSFLKSASPNLKGSKSEIKSTSKGRQSSNSKGKQRSGLSPHSPRSAKISFRKKEKPMLYVDVNISKGKSSKIAFYEGDQPEQVAEEFSKIYSLNQKAKEKLISKLNAVLDQYYSQSYL